MISSSSSSSKVMKFVCVGRAARLALQLAGRREEPEAHAPELLREDLGKYIHMYIYIYAYTYTYIYTCIYTYIYIYREREQVVMIIVMIMIICYISNNMNCNIYVQRHTHQSFWVKTSGEIQCNML